MGCSIESKYFWTALYINYIGTIVNNLESTWKAQLRFWISGVARGLLCSPHALGRLVLVVTVELWDPKHGLGEDRQEAQSLNEEDGVQQEVGDVGCHSREGQHALQVVHEAAPEPEGAPVEVWKWEGEAQTGQVWVIISRCETANGSY